MTYVVEKIVEKTTDKVDEKETLFFYSLKEKDGDGSVTIKSGGALEFKVGDELTFDVKGKQLSLNEEKT